jgi:hypothetical protein
MKYDLLVFGGGTAGVAAAYIAAKYGLKTLLVEKSDVLGGTITKGLVIPSMQTDTNNINTEFFNDLLKFAKKFNAQHTYIDGNQAWFNTELLKIALDEMLASVKCNVLFSCEPSDISFDNKLHTFTINLVHNLLSLYIETKYIVDATSNGKIFKILNCDFQKNSEKNQATTLRFMMSGIDTDKFADWLEQTDTDRNITTVDRTGLYTMLSTACTWDNNTKWALKPIFDAAVKNGDLEFNDTAYFQVFSVPNMSGTLNFNAPRIILNDNDDIHNPYIYSKAVKQGRERIYRLYKFCKKYFPGFENAFISHISDVLGIRESYRVKGKYTVTVDDIINPKQFENIAFCSDYPIDIHSNSYKEDKLEFHNSRYYVPIEALISEKFEQLYAAGRIISADFEAQAAIRTQLNCFSMGEAAAKDIAKKSGLLAN